MRHFFAFLLALFFAGAAHAQTQVQFGLQTGSNPLALGVYDQTHTFVPFANVDSTGHTVTFTGPATLSYLTVAGYLAATTSGTLTNGHCVSINAAGNLVDAGGACSVGGGGGTVTSATAGQLAYYASTGTTVSGATTGTGVLTALGSAPDTTGGLASYPVTNAKAAQMAATTVKCNYGAALANAADCTPAQINSFIDTTGATNVRQYGAVGDNVHDDSTAFQNALVASAQGELHIPCGTYLIKTGITVTTNAVYHITGEGTCSHIHFANTAPAVLFNFNLSASCGYAGYCILVDNVYFEQPDFQSVTTIAIKVNNGAEMRITRNTFLGWGQAINMQVAFGSTIDKNQFFNGTYSQISCNADASCNNVNILNNGFFNNASVAVIGTAVDCSTVNVNIVGNDVEGNGTGFLIQGVCAGILEGNYFELTPAPFYFGNGKSSAWTITGNNFSGDTITPSTSSFVLQNVSGLVFGGNTWYYQTLSYGSNLSGVVWYPQKNQAASVLPYQCDVNTKCSYLPNGMLLQTGTAATGAGSPGSVAVTFPTACPSTILGVSAVNYSGSAPSNSVSVGSPSLTGMTIWSVAGGSTVSWQVMCQ